MPISLYEMPAFEERKAFIRIPPSIRLKPTKHFLYALFPH